MTLFICCHSAFRSFCLHSLWHFLYVDHLLVFLAFLKSLALRLNQCKQQRCGSECAYVQSDPYLCYSLFEKYYTYSHCMQIFNILASFRKE